MACIAGSARMCLLVSFCTQLMLSTPPPIITGAPSTMMRCAAIAIALSPDEQKRLIDTPPVVMGSPARQRGHARHVGAGGAFEHRRAEDHVLHLAGVDARTLDGMFDRVGRQRPAHRSC